MFNALLYVDILLISIFGDVQLWGCSTEPISVQAFIDCIAVRLCAQLQSVRAIQGHPASILQDLFSHCA